MCNPPCYNGGTCTAPYECSCPGNYTGVSCLEDITRELITVLSLILRHLNSYHLLGKSFQLCLPSVHFVAVYCICLSIPLVLSSLNYFSRLLLNLNKYSRLLLSRLRLSRITAYLEVKIWSLFKHENLTSNKLLWKRERYLDFEITRVDCILCYMLLCLKLVDE